MSRIEQCISGIEEIIEELKNAKKFLEEKNPEQVEKRLIKSIETATYTMQCINDGKINENTEQ